MNSSVLAYGKKLFSIALIFNALVCIVYAVGLLTGFYTENWILYPPYILNGNLFWAVIAASILNIFPAAYIGQVKTGRLWFHHYVYGFLVLGLSVAFLVVCTSVSLLNLFTSNITDVAVNVGRFFVLGGLALVLDDLPDVSNKTASFVRRLKFMAYKGRKLIQVVQGLLGFVCLYFSVAISVGMAQNSGWVTVANLIFAGTLMITSLTSFWSVKRKVWHKIVPK
jgi:hypothetical protein